MQESPHVLLSPWSESMNQLMKRLDRLNMDIEEALSTGSSPSDTPCTTRRQPINDKAFHQVSTRLSLTFFLVFMYNPSAEIYIILERFMEVYLCQGVCGKSLPLNISSKRRANIHTSRKSAMSFVMPRFFEPKQK